MQKRHETMGVRMMFKVGDKVVGNKDGFSHRIGETGIVYRVHEEETWVNWSGVDVMKASPSGIDLVSRDTGKTLTELDVKPGDVVRSVDCTFDEYGDFTCKNIIADNLYKGSHTLNNDNYGQGIFGNDTGKWVIVSRAPQPSAEPAKHKRMHPDDAATACEQYLRDCGFTMARLDLVTALGAEYTIEPPRRF